MTEYNEKSIKILEGLEAVRKRPGMYIGSTDKVGLHHLIWEIVDNAIDEAINGYGKRIVVTLTKKGSIIVKDEGRGVPIGMHASGRSTPEVIYTILHAGGKFESDGYKVSGGLHGVGASVVNALSKWMKVTINKEGKTSEITFKNGGKVDQPLHEIGKSKETGTTFAIKAIITIFIDLNNKKNIADKIATEIPKVAIWELNKDWSILLYKTIRFDSWYVVSLFFIISLKSVFIFVKSSFLLKFGFESIIRIVILASFFSIFI